MNSLTISEHVSSLQAQVDFLGYICSRLMRETKVSENIKSEFVDLLKGQYETLSPNYLDGMERGFRNVFKESIPSHIETSAELSERVKTVIEKVRGEKI